MFLHSSFLIVSIASLHAGTIDTGGFVFTAPYFVSDGTTIQMSLNSTDGDFQLSGNGILGGANMACSLGVGACPFGQAYSIEAFFPDFSSFPAFATATIQGNSVGTVLLGCPNPAVCPDTSVRLFAQSVVISSPGNYAIPFFATGQIQAAVGNGPLLLNQAVGGIGTLHFSVTQSSPGQFQVDPGPGMNGSSALQWNFEAVPEPATALVTLFGLAGIGLYGLRVGLRRRSAN